MLVSASAGILLSAHRSVDIRTPRDLKATPAMYVKSCKVFESLQDSYKLLYEPY